ncbi:hypothetical protein [Enterococcus alishanensis]
MNNIVNNVTNWGFARISEIGFAKEILSENKFGRVGLGILRVADFESGTIQTVTEITNTVKNIGLGIAVLCFVLAGIGIMLGGALQQHGKKLLIGGIIGIVILVMSVSIRDYVQSKASE